MPARQKIKSLERALVGHKPKATDKTKDMKRVGGIYQKIISIENLEAADSKARKGKAKQYGVQAHDKARDSNLTQLHEVLKAKSYRTSRYSTFKVYEPKERLVYCLPYYPDRITHHAVMNYLEPVFVSNFTADTYSCIKGRGILGAAKNLKAALKDRKATRYYLSQYFANFYLSYFDHWLKEVVGVRHYFRYADDMVILAETKEELHKVLSRIRHYLATELKLEVKGNYQVFPVASRGIDFVGYVFYHSYILMRKSIKQAMARAVFKRKGRPTIAAYYGWAKHCNSRNLLRKLRLHEEFQGFGDKHTTDRVLERRQNRNGKDTEQRGGGREFYADAVKEVQRGSADAPDQNRQPEPDSVDWITEADRADKTGAERGFPF